MSTALIGAVGVAAAGAMHAFFTVEPVANVSSLADAVALARQQRVRLAVPVTPRFEHHLSN